MRILLLGAILILVTSVSADVYRTYDKYGNVIFTDKPSADAEKIKIDKVQTVSPPPVADFEYTPPKKSKKTSYTKLEILEPKNDQVFTDGAGDVTVSVLVQPELNTEQGDYLVLTLDGKKQTNSGSTSFSFNNLDRGTHTTKVAVVNEDGKSLKSSAAISFTIKRHSVLNTSRPSPP